MKPGRKPAAVELWNTKAATADLVKRAGPLATAELVQALARRGDHREHLAHTLAAVLELVAPKLPADLAHTVQKVVDSARDELTTREVPKLTI